MSLEEIRGFQTDQDGFKKLIWKEQTPFTIATDEREIKLAALHHQGRAKCKLTEYAGRLGVSWIARAIFTPSAWLLYQITRKLIQ